jgi:putative MATE family efflux protein
VQKRTRDFTEGSIPRHLIVFATPMLLGNLLQVLYNTVDSIWVGRFLGPEALAAVSVGFPIIFALVSLVMGLTMATTVLVSQYFGARQPENVVRTVDNSLLLLTVLGALVSVAGVVFRRPLLHLINTPPEIIDSASSYLAIFMAGLVFMFLFNAAGAIMRGLGDSRTPLRFLAYATGINIVLDPILIFGLGPVPAMGVNGAALATVVAMTVSAVVSLRYLFLSSGIMPKREWSTAWTRLGSISLDWELTRLTFKIGLPAGLQMILVSLSALAVSAFVNSFGAIVVAGYGAALRVDQFAFLPSMSVGLAVSALVGQNLGAGLARRVGDTVKWAVLLSGGITLLVALFALLWPDILMVPFTKDQSVLLEGGRYLRWVALAYVPLAMMFTLGGVLRGAGDTTPAMLFTVVSLWLIRVPLAKYLSSLPELGLSGIWIAIAFSPYIGVMLHYTYYRTGRWKAKVVATRQEPAAGATEPV